MSQEWKRKGYEIEEDEGVTVNETSFFFFFG